MWALHNAAGVPTSDTIWRRGVDYLLKTQTPMVGDGRALGCVIALARMLPSVDPKLPQLTEAEPQGIEPWSETVLFGCEADVKRLLGGGSIPTPQRSLVERRPLCRPFPMS